MTTIPLRTKARFMSDEYDATYATCGRCGQRLLSLAIKPPGAPGPERLPAISVSWGWHFDGAVWRPTPYHRRQRARALALLQNKSLTQDERATVRFVLRTNAFGRNDGAGIGNEVGNLLLGTRIRPGALLPTVAECPSCGQENDIFAA
jgi:hypothetical protein